MSTTVTDVGFGSGVWSRGAWGQDLTTTSLDGVGAIGVVGTDVPTLALALSSASASGTVATLGFDSSQTLSGVTGTGALGALVPGVSLALTSSTGFGVVGGFSFWATIITTQTPGWTPVVTTQTPSWTAVSDAQTPGWQTVK